MVERTGLSNEAFDSLVERVVSRGDDVPASIARLAKAARDANVPMLSHDDDSPEMRKAFRAQGVGIAEFPVNEETAREATEAGDFIVFGAPNVVRGGSHTGWTKAADMIAKAYALSSPPTTTIRRNRWRHFALLPTVCCRSLRPGT
jgi:alpha-D-ribose 1-methylphosphonate 5-triphosphate diphosphatase